MPEHVYVCITCRAEPESMSHVWTCVVMYMYEVTCRSVCAFVVGLSLRDCNIYGYLQYESVYLAISDLVCCRLDMYPVWHVLIIHVQATGRAQNVHVASSLASMEATERLLVGFTNPNGDPAAVRMFARLTWQEWNVSGLGGSVDVHVHIWLCVVYVYMNMHIRDHQPCGPAADLVLSLGLC
jgi:hypothetical protein